MDEPEGSEVVLGSDPQRMPTSSPAAPGKGSAPGASEGSQGAALDTSDNVSVDFSLDFAGDKFGSVTINVPDRPPRTCSEPCAGSVPHGTVISLQATPGLNSTFRGWSVPSCGAASTCQVQVDLDTQFSAEFGFDYNIAFVTSQSYSATGVPRPGAAANQECARLAGLAGLHGSRYIAWIVGEGPTTSEVDDITPSSFFQHSGGWVRMDGRPVARSLAALLRGELLHPLQLDEWGELAASTFSWSGASADGKVRRPSVGLCNDWTTDDASMSGSSAPNGTVDWGGSYGGRCNAINSLLCFGDDSDAQVPLPAIAGRLAFISASSFTSSTGIASADALCQQDACAAGLTGSADCTVNLGSARTFKSYLHTSVRRAWERFDLNGPTWVRTDGVQWLPSAAELADDASERFTALNVLANGTYLGGTAAAWTGDVAGTTTCEDWTNGTTAADGGFARIDQGGGAPLHTQGLTLGCEGSARLICLQE